MIRRAALIATIAFALFATVAATAAHAQGGAPSVLQLRAASSARAQIDGGTVLTSVFTVKNTGADTIHALPTITVPRGWTVVMGSAPLTLAPGATDTWLVGISVPASAAAKSYVVNGSLAAAGVTVSDTNCGADQ